MLPIARKSGSSRLSCCPRLRPCPLRIGPMAASSRRRKTPRRLPSRIASPFAATKVLSAEFSRARTSQSSGCLRREAPPRLHDPSLKICTTIHEMQAASRAARRVGKRLGFVPTMGALHEGHLSLVRAACAASDVVAASIFVNPTQFGVNEDLANYPRSFESDCEMLEREGVALLFAPAVDEMYPGGAATWVTVEGLSSEL